MNDCSLCGSELGPLISEKDAKSGGLLRVRLCRVCGLVQQSPLPTEHDLRVYYSHHYRQDYKNTYTPKNKYVYRAGIAARNRIDFLKKAIGPVFSDSGLKMLDVGAGGGEVVYVAQKSGLLARGIEPNQGYSEFARENYGISIETKHLDEVNDGPFDLVTMFHVLEHMPSPGKVMKKLYDLIRPNGLLMVEVPNIQQADASPANIFFKAHLFYFSPATLKAFASPYFEPIYTEDSGNLKILFRRLETEGALRLPSPAEVELTKLRLSKKGWIEYLTLGGGWRKPFRRVSRHFRESRLEAFTPRQILDSVIGN